MKKRTETLRDFAAGVMALMLEKLSSQLAALKTEEDIECLHRARVSTRRLRAALAAFSPCFPPAETRSWRRSIARITGILGEARDLDVQMEAVREELRNAGERERPGLARLELRLSRRREKIRLRLCAALDDKDVRRPLEEMLGNLRNIARKNTPEEEGSPVFDLCSDEICSRAADIPGFDGFVRNPESIRELHDLRKAVKSLRYALELFSSLISRLQPFIERLKNLQDFLGEIHDCDVWISFLPRFLEDEERRTRKYYGHVRTFPPLKTGILCFLEKKRTLREEKFGRFLEEWDRLGEEQFWDSIIAAARPLRPRRGEKGAEKS